MITAISTPWKTKEQSVELSHETESLRVAMLLGLYDDFNKAAIIERAIKRAGQAANDRLTDSGFTAR